MSCRHESHESRCAQRERAHLAVVKASARGKLQRLQQALLLLRLLLKNCTPRFLPNELTSDHVIINGVFGWAAGILAFQKPRTRIFAGVRTLRATHRDLVEADNPGRTRLYSARYSPTMCISASGTLQHL